MFWHIFMIFWPLVRWPWLATLTFFLKLNIPFHIFHRDVSRLSPRWDRLKAPQEGHGEAPGHQSLPTGWLPPLRGASSMLRAGYCWGWDGGPPPENLWESPNLWVSSRWRWTIHGKNLRRKHDENLGSIVLRYVQKVGDDLHKCSFRLPVMIMCDHWCVFNGSCTGSYSL